MIGTKGWWVTRKVNSKRKRKRGRTRRPRTLCALHRILSDQMPLKNPLLRVPHTVHTQGSWTTVGQLKAIFDNTSLNPSVWLDALPSGAGRWSVRFRELPAATGNGSSSPLPRSGSRTARGAGPADYERNLQMGEDRERGNW